MDPESGTLTFMEFKAAQAQKGQSKLAQVIRNWEKLEVVSEGKGAVQSTMDKVPQQKPLPPKVETQQASSTKEQKAEPTMELPHPKNVFIIVQDETSRRVLMVKSKKGEWMLPGGGFEKGKDRSAEDAVLRELKEESGYNLRSCDIRHIQRCPAG